MSDSTEVGALKDLMSRKNWTRLGEAPREILRFSAVVAWDDSRVITSGGSREVNIRTIEDLVFVYNKETMETSSLPSMIQRRAHHAAVIAGSNLFVIGGRGSDGLATNSIEVLDLNDPREWKQYPVKLEIARYNFSAVAVSEHEIYIIGGTASDILKSVEILNIATQTISQGPPLLEPRSRFSVSLVGNSVAVSGGLQDGGYRSTSSVEQLSMLVVSDEEARRWQPLQSMTTERSYHHGLSFGDCLVVVGGFNRGAPLTTTEVWSSATGRWTLHPAILPAEQEIRGFVKLGEDLMCFTGGDDPSVYCLFSASGLLEHQRRQIRFNELIADERTEIVIPLLLEGLGQRGWTYLFYECVRETNGRLIPQRNQSALGKRSHSGRMK